MKSQQQSLNDKWLVCCSLQVVFVAAAGSLRSVMDRRLDIDGVVIDSSIDAKKSKAN
jgi:hypothetical protein